MAALLQSAAGNLRVRELAAKIGYGERQLRRKFLEYLGLAPKDFARVLRVHAALHGVLGRRTWADLAPQHGYYDQPHLIGEFRELLGAAPDCFLRTLAEPRLLEADVIIQPKEQG